MQRTCPRVSTLKVGTMVCGRAALPRPHESGRVAKAKRCPAVIMASAGGAEGLTAATGQSQRSTIDGAPASACPLSDVKLPQINPEELERTLEDLELPTFKEKWVPHVFSHDPSDCMSLAQGPHRPRPPQRQSRAMLWGETPITSLSPGSSPRGTWAHWAECVVAPPCIWFTPFPPLPTSPPLCT